MFGSIDAFGGQAPIIVARLKRPTLPWRSQEIGLQLPWRGPSAPIEFIEVDTLPHFSLLVVPITIPHGPRRPFWADKGDGGVAQLQTDFGQHLLATVAHDSVRMHF